MPLLSRTPLPSLISPDMRYHMQYWSPCQIANRKEEDSFLCPAIYRYQTKITLDVYKHINIGTFLWIKRSLPINLCCIIRTYIRPGTMNDFRLRETVTQVLLTLQFQNCPVSKALNYIRLYIHIHSNG